MEKNMQTWKNQEGTRFKFIISICAYGLQCLDEICLLDVLNDQTRKPMYDVLNVSVMGLGIGMSLLFLVISSRLEVNY